MLPQLEHLTLNQQTYLRVRELIETGALKPGTQLDERTIASNLNISRTPLREAIATLVEEGLVERRPYQGNFVRVLNAKQINDLYEVRKVLEGLAIRLAVPRLTEENLAKLRAILEETQTALVNQDIMAYSLADQRFHEAIAQLSGNEILIGSLARLKRQIQLVRVRANHDPAVVDHTALERPLILAALEARDAETAEKLMLAHIEGVQQAVISAQKENTEVENV